MFFMCVSTMKKISYGNFVCFVFEKRFFLEFYTKMENMILLN